MDNCITTTEYVSWAEKPQHRDADYMFSMFPLHREYSIMNAAHRMGIFELLNEDPKGKTAETIKSICHLKPTNNTAERFLNSLTAFRFLVREGGYYRNSTFTEKYLLKSSECSSLKHPYMTQETSIDKWIYLGVQDESLTDCGSLYGDKEAWEKSFTPQLEAFVKIHRHLLDYLDFSWCTSAIDLGGASGVWARYIKKRYPSMDVSVVDLQTTIDICKPYADKADPAHQVKFVPGDFFKGPLPKADLCIISHVLNDWPDDKKVSTIFKNVYAALNTGGQLLLIQKVLDEDRLGPEYAIFSDITMSMFGGMERTLTEYSQLLTGQGFKSIRFVRNEGKNYCDFIIAKKL